MSIDNDQYGVAGHPVNHSWSPFIHGWFARDTEQAMTYRLYDIPPGQMLERGRELFAHGLQGLNITLPHKIAAVDLATDLTERAAHAGAINTLVRREDGSLLGDNTDGVGLLRDLRDNLRVSLARRRVLVIGAGGAARGVLAPLLSCQPAQIVVANRTPERAEKLAKTFANLGPVEGCGLRYISGGAFDVIINTTSAGLHGEMAPLPDSLVTPLTLCYDMIYGLQGTPFTRWAQTQGARKVHQGWGMLVEQAAESFQLWRGVRPDTAGVLAALEQRAGVRMRA